MVEKKTHRTKSQPVESIESVDQVDHSDEELLDTKDVARIRSEQKNQDTPDKFLTQIDELIDLMNKNRRDEREMCKKLARLYKQEIKTAKKSTRRRRNDKKTGFTKPETVPANLAKLVSLPEGTEMPRTQLTKRVYSVLRERGLFYEHDERVLRADDDVLKAFNLTKDVNKSTNPKDPDGLNFYNLQRHIANCYNVQNKPEEKENTTGKRKQRAHQQTKTA